MAAQRDKLKRWGLIVSIILGTMGIITFSFAWCDRADLTTPLQAASKHDVEDNTRRISQLEKDQAEILGRLRAISEALHVKYEPRVDDPR